MDSKKVRIGNYVYAFKTTWQIDGTDFSDGGGEDSKISTYKPISLTEEWHNKFGVEKNGFGNFEYDICPFGRKSKVFIFSGDYLYLRDMSGKYRSEDDIITIWNKDIKKEFYVHEWQNLYFALTGNELIVNTND